MPTQTPINLDQLLRVLNAATDKQNLQWRPTAEEETFRAQLNTGFVWITKTTDAARYTLSLLDREGNLLDEFKPSGEGESIALENLYKKARNQALQLDWKLQEVFDNLKALAGDA